MVVNGCESFDVSIGCAGRIGEGRKTWMHTFNIVSSWLLAQTPSPYISDRFALWSIEPLVAKKKMALNKAHLVSLN